MAVLPAVFQRNLIDAAIEPRRLDPLTGQSVVVNIPLAQRIHTLLYWSAFLAGAVIISEALAGFRVWTLARVGTWITTDLRHQVYAHLHDLSLRFFGKRRTGSLITRVTNDTDRLWDFIVFGSVDLVRDVAMIVSIAAVMFWLNWQLAMVSLLPLPILGIVTYKRGMKMQRMRGRLWTYW